MLPRIFLEVFCFNGPHYISVLLDGDYCIRRRRDSKQEDLSDRFLT